MKSKIIKAWVEALRSGEYKQGHHALCTTDLDGEEYFCCLGVLCDIAVDGYWVQRPQAAQVWALEWTSPNGTTHENAGIIPGPLRESLGISVKQEAKLIDLNDGGGYAPQTFDEIADHIEKMFLKKKKDKDV